MIRRKTWPPVGGAYFPHIIYIENFKKTSCQKPLDRFQYNIAGNVPFVTLYQDCSSRQKPWPPGGGGGGAGLFYLYNYIENFKNLLVRDQWTDFIITRHKCFLGDPLPSNHDSSKNMAARGRGLFFLYIYIEMFKNLPVRNQWTDFNITWQECFFGDPLPRLVKPS